jgi:tetratricopeptide (TPR) repeat protein
MRRSQFLRRWAKCRHEQNWLEYRVLVLGKYSLLRRDAKNKTIGIHRLVQAVQRDAMNTSTKKDWVERVFLALDAVLPPVEHKRWSDWERLVMHVQSCAEWIKQEDISFREATEMLQQTGWYLMERARYHEAEALLVQAYQTSIQKQGQEHLDTARDASTLASLYYQQGKYREAESLVKQALSIRERQLGEIHPDTAASLNDLALLYGRQGKYGEAEPLYERALSIYEQQLGLGHPDTQIVRGNYALLLRTVGRSEEAESLERLGQEES